MISVHRVRIVNVRPKSNSPIATGEFSFQADVLDQLDRYFRYVDLMRDVDPDAYALFGRIGASVIPRDRDLITFDPVLADQHFDIRIVPAFGCVYLPNEDGAEKIGAEFIWWRKLERALFEGVEAANGNVFCVTALYHDKGKHPVALTFHVSAPSFTQGRVLKELQVSKLHGRSRVGVERQYTISRPEWSYPHLLREVCAETGSKPNVAGIRIFMLAVLGVMSRRVGFQVRVGKAGRNAVFNIDESAGPKFFADRDLQVNENGRVKKIFHFVPGYQRTDGTLVTPHTKGLRAFDWKGYSVSIGKPDFDFANVENFTTAGVPDESRGRAMTMPEVAVLIDKHIRSHAWTKNRRMRRKLKA